MASLWDWVIDIASEEEIALTILMWWGIWSSINDRVTKNIIPDLSSEVSHACKLISRISNESFAFYTNVLVPKMNILIGSVSLTNELETRLKISFI